MGISLQRARELAHLMNPEDQARYSQGISNAQFYENHPEYAPAVPPQKTDKLEREEQRQFCNWCLLHNLPFVWHGTHKASTANLGVPDFVVGINGKTLFIEFKRDHTYKLSADQEKFAERLLAQGLIFRIVYSCNEAIKVLEEADSLW